MSTKKQHLLVVIDEVPAQQLADLGQHINSLSTPPQVTLIKTIPHVPARFHQLWDARSIQTKAVREASDELANAQRHLSLPTAARQVVHGSNPAKLAQHIPNEPDTHTIILAKQNGPTFRHGAFINTHPTPMMSIYTFLKKFVASSFHHMIPEMGGAKESLMAESLLDPQLLPRGYNNLFTQQSTSEPVQNLTNSPSTNLQLPSHSK